jgi:hypothetical protein
MKPRSCQNSSIVPTPRPVPADSGPALTYSQGTVLTAVPWHSNSTLVRKTPTAGRRTGKSAQEFASELSASVEIRLCPAPSYFILHRTVAFRLPFALSDSILWNSSVFHFEGKCWSRTTLHFVCANKNPSSVRYKPWKGLISKLLNERLLPMNLSN